MSGTNDSVGTLARVKRDVAAIDAAIIRLTEYLAAEAEVALPAAALVAIGPYAAVPLAVAFMRARSPEERAMIIAVMAHLDPAGPHRGRPGPDGGSAGEETFPRRPGSPRGRARHPKMPEHS